MEWFSVSRLRDMISSLGSSAKRNWYRIQNESRARQHHWSSMPRLFLISNDLLFTMLIMKGLMGRLRWEKVSCLLVGSCTNARHAANYKNYCNGSINPCYRCNWAWREGRPISGVVVHTWTYPRGRSHPRWMITTNRTTEYGRERARYIEWTLSPSRCWVETRGWGFAWNRVNPPPLLSTTDLMMLLNHCFFFFFGWFCSGNGATDAAWNHPSERINWFSREIV